MNRIKHSISNSNTYLTNGWTWFILCEVRCL